MTATLPCLQPCEINSLLTKPVSATVLGPAKVDAFRTHIKSDNHPCGISTLTCENTTRLALQRVSERVNPKLLALYLDQCG